MKPQINRQFMSVLWKFFLVRDLINNNNFTASIKSSVNYSVTELPEHLN